MSYLIRIRPEAERDVEKAFSWYEEQRPGLGREFITELDTVYERLEETPLIYADIHRGVRRALIRRFPLAVFYLVTEIEVRVLGVVRMARNPLLWQKRS